MPDVQALTKHFRPEVAARVRKFFGGKPTPLVSMSKASKEWGLGSVYVKDESKRLGQQAFKVFGATFGMASWLAKHRLDGIDIASVKGLEDLRARCAAKATEPVTFVTCTDGNHGR